MVLHRLYVNVFKIMTSAIVGLIGFNTTLVSAAKTMSSLSLQTANSALVLPQHSAALKSSVKCQSEHFEASCDLPGDIILMDSALYGRMQTNRCVSSNYGNLGCYRDVLAYMDGRCSGRRECRVYVGNPSLNAMQPCARDLTSYLEAAYQCVPSLSGTRQECITQGKVKVTAAAGYLASIAAQEEELGTSRCPWVLDAQPGQRWLISVISFGGVHSPATSSINTDAEGDDQSEIDAGQNQHKDVCYDVGLVRDRQRVVGLQACGGRGKGRRSGVQFQSEASKVEVELLSPDSLRSFAPFLVKVEVTGCAIQSLPKHATFSVRGDVATVTCNTSQVTWEMTCIDGRWSSDVTVNCTSGILLVVAMGVTLGVFTGGLLLTLAIVYMKRRRRMRAMQQQQSSLPPEVMRQQPAMTSSYYEASHVRHFGASSLVRGVGSDQPMTKEEQCQLMTSGSESIKAIDNVDLLATPSASRDKNLSDTYSVGVVACDTCARAATLHHLPNSQSTLSRFYECPRPPNTVHFLS